MVSCWNLNIAKSNWFISSLSSSGKRPHLINVLKFITNYHLMILQKLQFTFKIPCNIPRQIMSSKKNTCITSLPYTHSTIKNTANIYPSPLLLLAKCNGFDFHIQITTVSCIGIWISKKPTHDSNRPAIQPTILYRVLVPLTCPTYLRRSLHSFIYRLSAASVACVYTFRLQHRQHPRILCFYL